MVHLNAIACSLAGVSERPVPPGVGARRAGACHNAPSPDARRDRLTNAASCRLVRYPAKESPGRGSSKQLNETLQVTFALGGPEGERSRAAGGGESDRSGLFADAKAS